MFKRYALVSLTGTTRATVENYLPANYEVIAELDASLDDRDSARRGPGALNTQPKEMFR